MEGATCSDCLNAFSEKVWIPKVLQCGHTICLECLSSLVSDRKACPICNQTLSKSLNKYPTNITLLTILRSSNEKRSNPQEVNSLTDKVNSPLSKIETFKNLNKKRIFSFKNDLMKRVDQIYSLINELATSILQKYTSPKNELEKSTEEKFSSLTIEKSTDEEFSLKNELPKKFKESFDLLKKEIASSFENFIKLLPEEFELPKTDVKIEVMEELDPPNEVARILDSNYKPNDKNILHLSQYMSPKKFLRDIVARLQNKKKIYTYDVIETEGWRYSVITICENRLNIHSLSSSTIEKDAFVVSQEDLKKCIGSKEDVLLFIQIGKEKLIFTLPDNDDITLETSGLIKLCTAEGGQTLKGLKVLVDKLSGGELSNNSPESLNLNNCLIRFPTSGNGAESDYAFVYSIFCRIIKNKLPNSNIKFCYADVARMEGELHKDCQIDFDNLTNKKVEDCGISFSY